MRLSLGAKFMLAVTIILVGAMAANTLYFLGTASRFHEQQLIERGRALGRVISLISPDAILGFDFMLLNDYTREVSSQPDIAYGVIVNPKGVPISSYVNDADPAIKQRLEAGGSKNIEVLLQKLDRQEDLIQLKFPITHNKESLGEFLVGLSRHSLQNEFRRQLLVQLLVLAALVLFLGVAIHVVFRTKVLRPIRTLIAASQRSEAHV